MVTPEILAKAFSLEIRNSLTEAELRLANRRNKLERNPHVCHTHDFIDANMAMEAACNRLGLEVEANDAMFCALWSEAWDIAIAKRFR